MLRFISVAIIAVAITISVHASGRAQAALPTFTDVAKAAGITFTHNSGAFGKKYLPETMGAGGAFVDRDGVAELDASVMDGRTSCS